MKTLKFVLMVLIIISYACNRNKVQQLADCPDINTHFNNGEIKGLEKIIAFVDNYVIAETKIKDVNTAYHFYLDSIRNIASQDMSIDVAIDQDLKYQFLFSLDTPVFNLIWIKYFPKKIKTRDTILINPENFISIDLKWDSKYLQYLDNNSLQHQFYKEVIEYVEVCGGFCPTIYAKYLYINNEFDYNNVEDRLWAAIFILSIEESVQKKVERYLRK